MLNIMNEILESYEIKINKTNTKNTNDMQKKGADKNRDKDKETNYWKKLNNLVTLVVKLHKIEYHSRENRYGNHLVNMELNQQKILLTTNNTAVEIIKQRKNGEQKNRKFFSYA